MASSTRPPPHRRRRAQSPKKKLGAKKPKSASDQHYAAAPLQHSSVEVLNFLQPRETLRLIKARGGKRLVKFLRVVLPLSAAIVLAAILAWPYLHSFDGSLSLSLAAKMIPIPDLAVDHLRFTGTDTSNQPYSVTAERATRPGGAEEIYDLEKPEGDIMLKDGAWIAGKALRGRYDREGRKLWLGGDVQLFHDQGFQFTTNEAHIDMNDSSAWGEAPVMMQGQFGAITGKGFTLLDAGKVMVVKGPARAVLNLRPDASSGKPDLKKQ
ncbi:MAG: LPS export ABC transporter periplasmic protein LptC [Bdellovibrionales bacterium]